MRTTHQIAEPSVLDGNQTRVVTKTGTWQVTYDGYLLVHEERRATDLQPEAVACDYVWDPTEPVATRPLVFRTQSQSQLSPAVLYYTHDGNKNVSELVMPNATVAAHYEYAPFGALTVSAGSYAIDNPFRFSSEYMDDGLVLSYYNYRYYDCVNGRWLSADPLGENSGLNKFSFLNNALLGRRDVWGLWSLVPDFLKKKKLKIQVEEPCGKDQENDFQIVKPLFLVVINEVEYYVSADEQFKEWRNNVVFELMAGQVTKDVADIVRLISGVGDVVSRYRKERKMLGWQELVLPYNYLVSGFEIEYSVSCCKCVNGKYVWKRKGDYSSNTDGNIGLLGEPIPPASVYAWFLSERDSMESMKQHVRNAAESMKKHAEGICND